MPNLQRRRVFPQGDGAGLIAIGVVNFLDVAAMEAALNSPETAQVMTDVDIVTAIKPQRSLMKPL